LAGRVKGEGGGGGIKKKRRNQKTMVGQGEKHYNFKATHAVF